MSEFLIAGDVIDEAASYLSLDAEANEERLFSYLSMAQRRAWRSGAYKGFMREFDVRTYNHGNGRFLETPHGYNVLMGININTQPKIIRESYFQFHHNSLGSLTSERMRQFADYALEYRECPTLLGPQLLNKATQYKVIVMPRAQEDENSFITITGKDHEGQYLYTEVDGKTTPGVKIPLFKCAATRLDDIVWSEITGISKSITKGYVDVMMADDNFAEIIASIEPYKKRSSYRIYQIPESCGCGDIVHALFKISQPDNIVSREQRLIIDDFEAVLSLMKAIDAAYDKNDPNAANSFLVGGISALEQDVKASRSPTIKPIQFVGMSGEEMNDFTEF